MSLLDYCELSQALMSFAMSLIRGPEDGRNKQQ
jgi:hypothetical protein